MGLERAAGNQDWWRPRRTAGSSTPRFALRAALGMTTFLVEWIFR